MRHLSGFGRLLAAGALLVAGNVAAADQTGFSLGLAGTFSEFENDESTVEDSAVGVKVYGQYRVNDWFGIEAAWVNTGTFEEDLDLGAPGGNLKYKAKGYLIQGVGYLWPTDDLQPFVKAGLFNLDQNASGLGDDTPQPRSADGLAIGTGLRIAVSDNAMIRAEIDWYDLDKADLWTVNLGIDFRLPDVL